MWRYQVGPGRTRGIVTPSLLLPTLSSHVHGIMHSIVDKWKDIRLLQRSDLVCLLLEASEINDAIFRRKVGRHNKYTQPKQRSRFVITGYKNGICFALLNELFQ